MPHYYIDLRGHFGTSEDPTGIELPDITAAYSEALRVAGNLLESWGEVLPAYYNEIVIEIINEEFRPVLAIPYSDFAKHIALTGHDRSRSP